MNTQNRARSNLLPAILAGWFTYLAVDFLAHAVILAQWWRANEGYWLTANELFSRIPFGYASFAIYCGVLAWLLWRLYGDGLNLTTGLKFGAVAGLLYGLVFVLGAYSVFPMPPSALVIWPLTILVESAIAAGVSSWILVSGRPWRKAGVILLAAVILFIFGVLIQNILLPTGSTLT